MRSGKEGVNLPEDGDGDGFPVDIPNVVLWGAGDRTIPVFLRTGSEFLIPASGKQPPRSGRESYDSVGQRLNKGISK